MEGVQRSVPPQALPPIPETTIPVAHLAFPGGNVSMHMREALGSSYSDELFAPFYAAEGHPAAHPWQLALVSVMQCAENSSDRQAAEAVRARIEWQYALGLELPDSGFH